MIRLFYLAYDAVLWSIVILFVDTKLIEQRMSDVLHPDGLSETDFFDQNTSASRIGVYVDLINARSSALLGHISIMIAVLLAMLVVVREDTVSFVTVLIELNVYLFLATVCLRCIRTYGLETNEGREKENINRFNDLVFRYAAYRFANFGMMLGTLALIAVISFRWRQIAEGLG